MTSDLSKVQISILQLKVTFFGKAKGRMEKKKEEEERRRRRKRGGQRRRTTTTRRRRRKRIIGSICPFLKNAKR